VFAEDFTYRQLDGVIINPGGAVIMAYGHLPRARCSRRAGQTWDHVVVYSGMFTGHSLDIAEDLFALRITTVRKLELADVSRYTDG
jgi:hypothetical protein